MSENVEHITVPVEKRISDLKKFVKEVGDIKVTVGKNGAKASVKMGKFIAIFAPDEKWGQKLADGITEAILKVKVEAECIVKGVEEKYEQLTLEF